jgi:hypothetical protein
MKTADESTVWSVEIAIEESPDETEARAHLEVGERTLGGWGRARRNPRDPEVPRVGEELAAARALSDLAHKLLDEAADVIEDYEGRPVQVHE